MARRSISARRTVSSIAVVVPLLALLAGCGSSGRSIDRARIGMTKKQVRSKVGAPYRIDRSCWFVRGAGGAAVKICFAAGEVQSIQAVQHG